MNEIVETTLTSFVISQKNSSQINIANMASPFPFQKWAVFFFFWLGGIFFIKVQKDKEYSAQYMYLSKVS